MTDRSIFLGRITRLYTELLRFSDEIFEEYSHIDNDGLLEKKKKIQTILNYNEVACKYNTKGISVVIGVVSLFGALVTAIITVAIFLTDTIINTDGVISYYLASFLIIFIMLCLSACNFLLRYKRILKRIIFCNTAIQCIDSILEERQ